MGVKPESRDSGAADVTDTEVREGNYLVFITARSFIVLLLLLVGKL